MELIIRIPKKDKVLHLERYVIGNNSLQYIETDNRNYVKTVIKQYRFSKKSFTIHNGEFYLVKSFRLIRVGNKRNLKQKK